MLDTKFYTPDFILNNRGVYLFVKKGLLHAKKCLISLIHIKGFLNNRKLKVLLYGY
jgi:hypothetical protein